MRPIDADAFIDYLNKSLDDAVDSSATFEGALLAAAIKEAFVMDLKNEKVTPTINAVEVLDSAKFEPLTDTEQRIFLAAMSREKTVCKLVDEEGPREPYEKSLVRACNEIIRKVKGALWT